VEQERRKVEDERVRVRGLMVELERLKALEEERVKQAANCRCCVS
jgi:hypothetical protein